MIEKLKNYSFFIIYLLYNPHLLFLFFKGIYLPVYIQFEWFKKYDIKTIIDVGACQGRVSKSLNYLFPEAKIYAFEPIEENFKQLARKLNTGKATLEKIALSHQTGNSTFYVNKYLPASSILPLEANHLKRHPHMANAKKTTVKTTTLDSYFKNKRLKKIVFLKIDTQGTEHLVLRGGQEFLSQVSIIHIETSFSKMYKNQGDFNDIYKILTGSGFRYFGEARESQFYPIFNLSGSANSIFINNQLMSQTLK